MKGKLYIPNAALTRIVQVPAERCAIPGWPEIPAVLRRPVDFTEDPAGTKDDHWIVSCAVSGISFMHGKVATFEFEAIEIAAANFNSTADQIGRERLIARYKEERDRYVRGIRDLGGEDVSSLTIESGNDVPARSGIAV